MTRIKALKTVLKYEMEKPILLNVSTQLVTAYSPTPVTTEIASSGILNGYPSGHIYIDDIIKDADVYTTSISITDTDWPIVALESIVKLNVDGSQTELATSGATIAGDGLSFTHTGLNGWRHRGVYLQVWERDYEG